MRLNYSVTDPSKIQRRRTKWGAVLEEFVKSGKEVAALDFDEGEYSDSKSAQATVYNAIRNYKLRNTVRVRMVEGKLYLIRIHN